MKHIKLFEAYVSGGGDLKDFQPPKEIKGVKDIRFKTVISKDFKTWGTVDHIRPNGKLAIEINPEGDYEEVELGNVYILTDDQAKEAMEKAFDFPEGYGKPDPEELKHAIDEILGVSPENLATIDTINKMQFESLDEESEENSSHIEKTLMFHCDAKSCEHYKEQEGTTNCVLKEISISLKGGCNQYEPKS